MVSMIVVERKWMYTSGTLIPLVCVVGCVIHIYADREDAECEGRGELDGERVTLGQRDDVKDL